MAQSFLTAAGKKVTDVKTFLREAASGASSIKYSAEKNAKHVLYFPSNTVMVTDEATGVQTEKKEIIAIHGGVHEWNGADGKYKACICMKDVVRQTDDGTFINDGSCPICDRTSDGWDIYRYRKELAESQCQLTGEDRKKHIDMVKQTLGDERKAKEARDYAYILVAKFRVNPDNSPVIGTTGMPEYDLKVFKTSSSRLAKMQEQIENSGLELPGVEIMISYPNVEDRRLLTGQCVTTPVYGPGSIITKFPEVKKLIMQDVSKFDWAGIEKAFPEWTGMGNNEATNIVDAQFQKWDEYKRDMLVNPSARYMEYITNTPVTNPTLGIPTAVAGAMPDANAVFGAPSAIGTMVMPGMAPMAPPAAPAAPMAAPNVPDVNAVFGQPAPAAPAAPTAPTLQI